MNIGSKIKTNNSNKIKTTYIAIPFLSIEPAPPSRCLSHVIAISIFKFIEPSTFLKTAFTVSTYFN
jgi:hypothetical protein